MGVSFSGRARQLRKASLLLLRRTDPRLEPRENFFFPHRGLERCPTFGAKSLGRRGARLARSSHVSLVETRRQDGREEKKSLGRPRVLRATDEDVRRQAPGTLPSLFVERKWRRKSSLEAAESRPARSRLRRSAQSASNPPMTTSTMSMASLAGQSGFRLAMDNFADPQTGVAPRLARSRNVRSRCRCSMCPAIHISSRSWLRSSSTHEPSDPPPKVVLSFLGDNGTGDRSAF